MTQKTCTLERSSENPARRSVQDIIRNPHTTYNNGNGGSDTGMMGDDRNDDILVIGIDFGTTFSGVAWSTAADFARNEINLVTSWPGSGTQEAKAPTELFYEYGQVMWGYDIPLDADPIRWFKLLLVKDEDLTKELRNSEPLVHARKFVDETEKKPVELIADYLRALFEHTLYVIRKARGQSVLDALRFHVVITVPAIWQDYARQDMEQAAEMAGIMDSRPAGQTKLTFAPEPEAAALSTLYESGRNLNKGDVFVICDAGGGTVDLITYEVTNNKPLAIKEVGEGTGGLCGGVFIDKAFEKACRDRLGRKWGRLSPAVIKDLMKKEWEVAIKSTFKPDTKRSNREYIVGFPLETFRTPSDSFDDLSKQPLIKNGRIHFQQSHIKGMFAGSFRGIDTLVNNQIRMALKKKSKVTGIILVGGLGTSPYLYEHLKDKHSTSNVSEILQSGGIKPRTAICRGAIYKGFLEKPSGTIVPPIEVTSTVSRYSYGIKYVTEYNEAQHLREDKMWDGSQWRARNQIKWYLKRGAVVPKSPVRYSFYEYIKDVDDFDGTLNITLWVCEELDPPDREDSRVSAKCKFQLNVTTPYSKLPDWRTADGTMVKKLGYEIGMIPSGASLDFAVYMDGKELMSQDTSYTSVRF
ncbi:Heat shock 70 kDa protein 12B [Colletotrichum fructicola]|uniref:Hsp70 family chaperone n=1 Tax=Colletotrichum fructicola (strain Nara gc5) TaxID=1213859 RepID=L2GED9_COLFN|nr:Heat shock 70 kDa protein 12B [Colletotrichum fructicola]